MPVTEKIAAITEKIVERSHSSRRRYLERIEKAQENAPRRSRLGCANLAHGFAACGPSDKAMLREGACSNLAIVTAYNDMLSAHQPFERFPDIIREAAREAGATAQVAGGVPAMCDGVTQGEAGMELSLFSRDVIALSTAVALSHQMFDAAVYLGVCDKIVPGLIIGALSFGHLPSVFIPAGPMTSGLANDEKSKIRQLHTEGKVGRAALLEAKAQSYHGPGTCTFYGTANSNQMLMEIMGLHLPGTTFVNPNTSLRDEITRASTRRALAITASGNDYTPIGRIVDERTIVNGVVGLLATGGSTNHTIHLVAMAAAAGIHLTWEDMAELSAIIPLLTRIYPNGKADVNHFHAAGGMGFLIRELLGAGLLHQDVKTVWGSGLEGYLLEPRLQEDGLAWAEAVKESGDEAILRGCAAPFDQTGGIAVLDGDIGRAVIKSASPHLPFAGGIAEGVQNGRAHRRCGRRGPLPGAQGQWHARTPQAHAAAGRAAGSRPPCRSGDRWAHVGRFRQGAGRHPCDAGSRRRRRHRQDLRWRHDQARCRSRPPRGAGRCGRMGIALSGHRRSERQ